MIRGVAGLVGKSGRGHGRISLSFQILNRSVRLTYIDFMFSFGNMSPDKRRNDEGKLNMDT